MAVLLASAQVAASPADTFGLGSRSTAMGSAVSADVRDFSANYYNPSGLALARGLDISAGYYYADHALEMNGKDSQVDPVRGIVGGLVAPGSFGFLPFAFGIATFLPDDRLSRARASRQEDPRWVMYDNRTQLIFISANLAIRPFDWLAIGGGMTWLAATRGAFGISGTAVLPAGNKTEYDSQLRHEVDADLTTERYPEFGITVRPHERLDLALVYRHQATIELDVDAELTGTVDATLIKVPARYTLDSYTVNAYIPRQLVLGESFRPIDELSLNLDLKWVQWSAFKSPVSRSSTTLDVNVPPGIIELPPNPKPTKIEDPAFTDRIVPELGVEYRLAVTPDLTVPIRAGYIYERSPVPDQSGITNYVDTDRHVLSFGTGVVLREPGALLPGNVRFDAHAQWSILPTRITLKDNPADYVGDYRARGSILNVGATVSLGFE
ncbi:MAG: outer membrane protein transport protein [Polyangiaceae bacterium]|nr:outer membrane protein transport protein [Polyangiaceae bacterium]MCL4752049.1 outer membrane protein transport protein [Myxococcales bacterium]